MLNNLNTKCTGTKRPYPQTGSLVTPSHVSDGEPSDRGEGMTVERRPYGELMVNATPLYKKVLALLTMYGELSAARFAEEFAPVRARLQQEWIFVAGFVSRFTILFFFLNFPLIPRLMSSS